MTAITTWGPYTWFFLHIMAEKIKEEHYEKCRADIINVITSLLKHLPCDYCAEHASKIIKHINVKNLHNKEAVKMFLFKLHNDVSNRTKLTKIEDIEILKKYEMGNLKIAAVTLYKVFHTNDKEHMMNEFSRSQMLKSIQPIIQKLINHSN